MATMTDLVAKIAAETTLVGGLTTFVKDLHDQIAAIPGIPPVVQAQIDGAFAAVTANSASISSAMIVNTPPAPPAP